MASFEKIQKDVLHLVTSMGQRKILSTHEESNLTPSDSTKSHRNSMVSKAYYEVHISHASYILLGSAISMVSCL